MPLKRYESLTALLLYLYLCFSNYLYTVLVFCYVYVFFCYDIYLFIHYDKNRGEWGNNGFLRFKGFQKPQFLPEINKRSTIYLLINITTPHKKYFNVFYNSGIFW